MHHQQTIDQWHTWLSACVKAKGHHFEHLLWSRHANGTSEPLTHQKELLTHQKTSSRLFSEQLTILIRRQLKFAVLKSYVHV